MFQPQTASYGRRRIILANNIKGHRTVAIRWPYGRRRIILANNIKGHRAVAIRWPYGRRRIILVNNQSIVPSPYGGRAGDAG